MGHLVFSSCFFSLFFMSYSLFLQHEDLKTDYGTFGLWGAVLAGGETVVSKRTFRYSSILKMIYL